MGGMHNGEAMEAQASIDGLMVKELPDELQFRYNCNYNYGSELLIFVALAVLFVSVFFNSMEMIASDPVFREIVFAVFFGGFLCIGISAARNRNRVYATTLSVTSQRFEAAGDNLKPDWRGHCSRPGAIIVPVSEVRMLGYSPRQQRGSKAGLYVNSRIVMKVISLPDKCLLPGLSREQTTAVIAAIVRKFPEIGPKIHNYN